MRRYYNYNEYLSDTKMLIAKIGGSNFDTIIAIARGGLTLGHMLGEYYNIREVYAVNTIGYDDTQKRSDIELFNIPKIENAKSVLIVDDIVDSGETMQLVLSHLSNLYPECSFKTAALFYKRSAVIEPDWYAQIAEEWIDFFWSVDLKQ